jgi:hypothetical protein
MSTNQKGLVKQLQPFKNLFFNNQRIPMLNQKEKEFTHYKQK